MQAFGAGLRDVARAPLLLAFASLATLAVAAPLSAVMLLTLRDALERGHPARGDEAAIAGDWWQRMAESPAPLATLFAPETLGFAAVLEVSSRVAEAIPPPAAILMPIAAAALLWAALWGAALSRFGQARPPGWRHAWRAARFWFAPFAIVSGVAAVVALALYLTVHPLLFGVLYPLLADGSNPVADTILRLGHAGAFALVLAGVSVMADLTRIATMDATDRALGPALTRATALVIARPGAVLSVCLLYVILGTLLLSTYGAVEVIGRSQVGGWRGVAVAQAYIAARIVLRLARGASLLALYRQTRPPAPVH